jgi:hypothetical protein
MKKYLSMFVCVLFLVSSILTSSVFAANISESENNDTLATANKIKSDGVISGKVSRDTDRDYFKVMLPSKSTLKITLTSATSLFNYGLYLLDSNGNQICSYDDYESSKKISRDLTADTYYIQVFYFGSYSPNLNYSLSVAGIPDSSSYEHGGDVYEYNDSFSRATNIGEGSFTISQANIHPLGDVDYFEFSLNKNVNATFTIATPYLGLNYRFAIYDSNCRYVTSGGGTSELKVNLQSGDYYIKVYGVDSESVLNYTLRMSTSR